MRNGVRLFQSVSAVAAIVFASAAGATLLTGTVAPGTSAEYFIPVNAGDILTLSVAATPPALTRLNLFDPTSALVAIASGNAADGLGSIIDWTALIAGNMLLEVVNSNATSFDFSLVIDGNTAGPPFAAAPEPATLALLSLGLAGLGFARRKR